MCLCACVCVCMCVCVCVRARAHTLVLISNKCPGFLRMDVDYFTSSLLWCKLEYLICALSSNVLNSVIFWL